MLLIVPRFCSYRVLGHEDKIHVAIRLTASASFDLGSLQLTAADPRAALPLTHARFCLPIGRWDVASPSRSIYSYNVISVSLELGLWQYESVTCEGSARPCVGAATVVDRFVAGL